MFVVGQKSTPLGKSKINSRLTFNFKNDTIKGHLGLSNETFEKSIIEKKNNN